MVEEILRRQAIPISRNKRPEEVKIEDEDPIPEAEVEVEDSSKVFQMQ